METIVSFLRKKAVPSLLFCRGSSYFAPQLASIKPNGISVDWNGDLQTLRQQIPKEIALQGNFDPFLLFAPQDDIQKRVHSQLDQMQTPGYIVNLGHGVHRLTPEANVKFFVETVQNYSPAACSF